MDENSSDQVESEVPVPDAQPDDPVEGDVVDASGAEEAGDDPFSLDLPGGKPRFDYLRIIAGTFIGLVIVGIVLFSVTDLSSLILPMEDRYLDVLVPPTETWKIAISMCWFRQPKTEQNRLCSTSWNNSWRATRFRLRVR